MDETTADSSFFRQQSNPYVVPDYYSPDVPSPSSSHERRMSTYRKPLPEATTSYQGAEVGQLTAPSPSTANAGLAIGNIDYFASIPRSNVSRGTPAPIDIDGNSPSSTKIPPRPSGAVRSPSGAPQGSPNTPASIDPLLSPNLTRNPGTSGTFYPGDPFLSPSSTIDGRFAGKLDGPYGRDDEEGDLGHASFNPYHASSDHETLRGMDSSASIRPSGSLPYCVTLSHSMNRTNIFSFRRARRLRMQSKTRDCARPVELVNSVNYLPGRLFLRLLWNMAWYRASKASLREEHHEQQLYNPSYCVPSLRGLCQKHRTVFCHSLCSFPWPSIKQKSVCEKR